MYRFIQKVPTAFKVIGAVAVNAAIITPAILSHRRGHQRYLNLPPDEQREMYEQCPEQVITNDGSMYAAFFHAGVMNHSGGRALGKPMKPWVYEGPTNKP